MNNFWQRILTGSIFIGVVAGSIVYGPLSFQIVFLWIALLSLDEFYKLIKSPTIHPNKTLGLITGAAIYILLSGITFNNVAPKYLSLIFPIFAVLFIAELYRKKDSPFTNIAITSVGILYAVVPFALLNLIGGIGLHFDAGILIGYFILLWTSDSFAYVFGMLFGKHRLFERISPKKSWEGFLGAILCSSGSGYLLSLYYTHIAPQHWIAMAIIIVVCGTLGDLTESMLKRSLNVKDSGTILPGHGGLLDRFDGLLLSVPFIWAYLNLFY